MHSLFLRGEGQGVGEMKTFECNEHSLKNQDRSLIQWLSKVGNQERY
jgi:hypothetical protein